MKTDMLVDVFMKPWSNVKPTAMNTETVIEQMLLRFITM